MRFALLVARQRSGTGALGSVLDQHPEIAYLGEVFHPGNAGEETNYFTHLGRRVAEDPENAMPWRARENFDAFLAAMAARRPGCLLVVDVKYRSLHHLAEGWQSPVARPWILQEARRRDAPVLHLTRRNHVETFVSGRLAEANRVWHAAEGTDLAHRSIVVDVRRLSEFITEAEREAACLGEWLAGHPRCLSFDYGELFDAEGLLEAGLAGKIAGMLEVAPPAARRPAFVKQAPRAVGEAVENIELVRTALSGTPHAWMAR